MRHPRRAEPARDLGRVTAQCGDRRRHFGAQGGIDGLVAHAETEDHPASSGIGDQARRLGAGVGVAHVDAGDPGAHFHLPGCLGHQLRGCKDVAVHFGGEDRVEAGLFSLPRDRSYLSCTPPSTR